ncbi:GGDEF domain-containing protein [Actinopolyspora saharensis]|uniref:Diguanylate cyclase (GGDEF) domain-containing protein n=1 Tax=Actinopolyspora saharensis TaxID=995062 RepID=A0A1H0YAZ3_9ACTN|nr:GGDEF domain-containing protein [Actinopolyspora saharensis]SDQ12260.1 diguanylate cyclase (GGDEF) domain-containing protein [Actinopolyspora saharensis]
MNPGSIDHVLGPANDVRFAFQPLINIRTGAVVSMEALARPAEGHVTDLFREAARDRRVGELDVELAVSAVDRVTEQQSLLPLHLNVFGGTVAYEPERMRALHDKLAEVGRRAPEITLELSPPFARLEPTKLRTEVHRLRSHGYRIAVDGIGEGDVPLKLITDLRPDAVKLDPGVVRGLPDDPGSTALLESLRGLCESIGAVLIAEGVESEEQLEALRQSGVRTVQGNLLAPAARRPPTSLQITAPAAEITDAPANSVPTPAGPRVTDFLSPATMLPSDATADSVRGVLSDHPEVSGVVLVDEHNRPEYSIDRNRFLLAVTGPYGHALHAQRPAARLADEPRVVNTATTAMEALNLVSGSDQTRVHDDAVVVDEQGRCLGVVRAVHLIRGMAEFRAEQAAALNPLTRLPGSDAIQRDVDSRIASGEVFALSWLDIDGFKSVNDKAGFSAGDELIRSVGRSLTDAATSLSSVRVGHVGGDDFLLVANLDDLVTLAEMVLDPPRESGGIRVGLSLSTLVCTQSGTASYQEASRLLVPLKQQAKSLVGSSWVMSRIGSDRVDVLRGSEGTPVRTEPAFPDRDPDPPLGGPAGPNGPVHPGGPPAPNGPVPPPPGGAGGPSGPAEPYNGPRGGNL